MLHEVEVYEKNGVYNEHASCVETITQYLAQLDVATDFNETVSVTHGLFRYIIRHVIWARSGTVFRDTCLKQLNQLQSNDRVSPHDRTLFEGYRNELTCYAHSLIRGDDVEWFMTGRRNDLGDGTHGYVYRYSTPRGDVAVKTISSDDILIQEASILASLDHPAILKLEDVIIQRDNKMAMVLPLASSTLCQSHALSLKAQERETIIYQLLHAICYMHSHGVLHGDLKPANILLYQVGEKNAPGGRYRAKICDFTLATTYGFDRLHEPHGVFTLWWRAPEILLGQPYNPPADVWALGCIVYELLYDKHPFQPKGGSADPRGSQLKAIFDGMGPPTDQSWPEGKALYDARGYSYISVYCRPILDFTNGLTPLAANLLSLMLVLDPSKRATIPQLIEHPIFDRVRPVFNYPISPPYSRKAKILSYLPPRSGSRALSFDRDNLYQYFYKTIEWFYPRTKDRGIQLFELFLSLRSAAGEPIEERDMVLYLFVAFWLVTTVTEQECTLRQVLQMVREKRITIPTCSEDLVYSAMSQILKTCGFASVQYTSCGDLLMRGSSATDVLRLTRFTLMHDRYSPMEMADMCREITESYINCPLGCGSETSNYKHMIPPKMYAECLAELLPKVRIFREWQRGREIIAHLEHMQ